MVRPPPWLRHPLTGAGLLFLLVNLTVADLFYRVNNVRLLTIGLAVTLLTAIALRRPPERLPPWSLIPFLALPLLASLPGLLVNTGPGNYQLGLEVMDQLALALWTTLLVGFADASRPWRPLLASVAVTVILVGLWAGLEALGIEALRHSVTPGRMAATFGNANFLAGFLVVLLPLMTVLALSRGEAPLHPGLFAAALATGGVGLYLTGSRAALAITLLTVLLTLLGHRLLTTPPEARRPLMARLPWLLAGLAGAAAVLIGLAWSGMLGPRGAELLTSRGWAPRLHPWQTAIAAIADAPWLGYGPGSSYNLYFAYASPLRRLDSPFSSYRNVHNEPLEVLEEGGLLGLAAWLLFWFLLLRAAWSVIRRGSGAAPLLALGLAAGWLGYLLHGLFDLAARMMAVELPVFTGIALLLVLERENREGENLLQLLGRPPSPALYRLGLAGSLTLFWLLALPWLQGQYQLQRVMREDPETIAAVEATIETQGNIHILHHLAGLQMRDRRADALARTLARAERVFPGYRDMAYYAARLAILRGDLEGARRLARDYQGRDLFHEDTIILLSRLAALRQEREPFRRQLFLMAEKVVLDQRLGGSDGRVMVYVREASEGGERLEVRLPGKGGVELVVGAGLIDAMMADVRHQRPREERGERLVRALTAGGWLRPCAEPPEACAARQRFAEVLIARLTLL